MGRSEASGEIRRNHAAVERAGGTHPFLDLGGRGKPGACLCGEGGPWRGESGDSESGGGMADEFSAFHDLTVVLVFACK
jgi:hypothetical protein